MVPGIYKLGRSRPLPMPHPTLKPQTPGTTSRYLKPHLSKLNPLHIQTMGLLEKIKTILHIGPPGDTRPWIRCVKCLEYVQWGEVCKNCGMQN